MEPKTNKLGNPLSKRTSTQGLYIALISVHGLIRGNGLELGRDADTGGQTKYVVELARALAEQPEVAQVDLFTRMVIDPRVSDDYSQPVEIIHEHQGHQARIIRIEAGPKAYIPKEHLWDHLDAFTDNMMQFFRQRNQFPDLLHSHYADAAYIGSQLTHQLGVPLLHTGHSLGRVKRRRLLAAGLSGEEIEERYNMSRRVEAEEQVLISAERVIASTSQEIEEQYGLYDHHQPDIMRVVPPGTDLDRFHPADPDCDEASCAMANEIRRFLHEPEKPMILALSRPDARKNIAALIKAYGESPELQQLANLVIVAGNRDDLADLDEGAQEVWRELLLEIDRYDLYGRIAYPKTQTPKQVRTGITPA